MAFKPGHPKYGGRKKGSTTCALICEKHNVNVFEEMLLLALAEHDRNAKFNKLRELAPYLYAKPKDEFDLSKVTPEQLRDLIHALDDNEETAAG